MVKIREQYGSGGYSALFKIASVYIKSDPEIYYFRATSEDNFKFISDKYIIRSVQIMF